MIGKLYGKEQTIERYESTELRKIQSKKYESTTTLY